MSFQICIKTDKSLQQLATEIRELLSLPPFTLDSLAEEPYCQFDMLGILVLIRYVLEDDREPEVKDYHYYFDGQMSFTEHEIDTDAMEYNLQPYYAQLLAFRLDLETACYEKKRVGQHWQIRYCYYKKNPDWNPNLLFGEPGWVPAILVDAPGPWRSMHTIF
ncbi:hypothetical protein [Dictyobacter arantiisoli]|uniref:Uncharacterized protein n=1 Tax=Dictyobacter arantiisoli TaxID=2014874 RepID=A0A5A5T637_9CHLR|nr:hypothetical protein [Dictyobacter arantiisoli]GCF06695.1 hypothetical protein KDI_02590 [Dictyobacter arantiisoli]